MILIDGRSADHQPTGVGRYTRQLVRNWPNSNLTVLTNKPEVWEAENSCHPIALPTGPRFHGMAAELARKHTYWSPESLVVSSLVPGTTLTIHDLTPLTIPTRHTTRNRVFHHVFLRRGTSSAQSIIVPTRHVADEVLRHLPPCRGKIHIIHEGPSFEFPAENHESREKVVTYLGTIEPRKNVLSLIRAFQVAKLPGWRLRIIGKLGWLDDGDTADFHKLAQSGGVEWVGWLPDAEVAEALAVSSVLAYPSADEGFGLPVLEGMAAGCAVLTSDAPALREVAGEAAVYAHRTNLDAELPKLLKDLMSDAAMRSELGQKARARAEMFSWRRAAAETMACLIGERAADA